MGQWEGARAGDQDQQAGVGRQVWAQCLPACKQQARGTCGHTTAIGRALNKTSQSLHPRCSRQADLRLGHGRRRRQHVQQHVVLVGLRRAACPRRQPCQQRRRRRQQQAERVQPSALAARLAAGLAAARRGRCLRRRGACGGALELRGRRSVVPCGCRSVTLRRRHRLCRRRRRCGALCGPPQRHAAPPPPCLCR